MARIPLMVISDAPTSSTGLGRITRELCERIQKHLSDTFELATFGFGGTYSSTLPWRQYTIRRLDNWVPPELPTVWYDHAGMRTGILLAIWNPGWLPWLADAQTLPPSGLRTFLEARPFEKWIYAPVDAEGFNCQLPEKVTEILDGFDRVLHYSDWATSIDPNKKRNEFLPHGIDTSVFYPRDAKVVRANFFETVAGRHAKPIKDDVKIIGIVATNSGRKDWGLAFEACSELLKRGVNLGIWAHVDVFGKHWDLVDMANNFGLANKVIFTNGFLNDETMALAYSGCNCTLGIGSSEGFGYPIFESIACGTPCIHGDYGGAAEWLPEEFKVKPSGFKWSGGIYNSRYPVFDARDWADKVQLVLGIKAVLPEELEWEKLWPKFENWLLAGVNG